MFLAPFLPNVRRPPRTPTHALTRKHVHDRNIFFRVLSLDDPVLKLLYDMPVIVSVTGHKCSHSHCAIKESMFVLTVMVGGPSPEL